MTNKKNTETEKIVEQVKDQLRKAWNTPVPGYDPEFVKENLAEAYKYVMQTCYDSDVQRVEVEDLGNGNFNVTGYILPKRVPIKLPGDRMGMLELFGEEVEST